LLSLVRALILRAVNEQRQHPGGTSEHVFSRRRHMSPGQDNLNRPEQSSADHPGSPAAFTALVVIALIGVALATAIFFAPRWGSASLSWILPSVTLLLTGVLCAYLLPLLRRLSPTQDAEVRARSEQALRDSEALYHSLAESLPLNLIRKDLQGRVSYCNERYCNSMGTTAAALLGKTDFDLYPRNLAEKYVANDRQVTASGQVFEDVEAYHSPEGDDLYMHVLKSPVYDAAGKIVGLQVVFWDVTDRWRAEKALEQTAADLSRSNQELELFAYVASHDLQEPLRMIASYTQLLARRYKDNLDQEAHEFIGYAVDGAVRMQNLINDLLAYSRVGTRPKQLAKVDWAALLKTTLQNLRLSIEESGAEVTHDALPIVLGDGVQLGQLLQNMISNAIKFRGDAKPRIHLGARQEADQWLFSVQDNGIGIDAEYFERIFIVFQRLHQRSEYPGTGIGLAICKKIVERHGGEIWVESSDGQGSTFFFTLPLNPPPSKRPAPVTSS